MSVRYIFSTAGEYVAFVTGSNLWSQNCEWLGFIVNGNEVYDPQGKFFGVIMTDDRVVKNDSIPQPPLQRRLSRPLKPQKPYKPLKRLRMAPVPQPFHDVFDRNHRTTNSPYAVAERKDFSQLFNSTLVACDGELLGKVTHDRFGSDSIANEFGPHGSPFQSKSIFNQFGPYGSPFSPKSPYNQFSQQGPKFLKFGKVLGTLTANTFVSDRIDPTEFVEWLKR